MLCQWCKINDAVEGDDYCQDCLDTIDALNQAQTDRFVEYRIQYENLPTREPIRQQQKPGGKSRGSLRNGGDNG